MNLFMRYILLNSISYISYLEFAMPVVLIHMKLNMFASGYCLNFSFLALPVFKCFRTFMNRIPFHI